MFPCSSSNVFSTGTTGNYYEPAAFPHDQPFSIQGRPFLNDLTTNPNCNFASVVSSSTQDQDLLENTHHDHMHPPLSFFYFPSPFEDDDVLLQQQQQQQQQKQVPTMRGSSKKDRHSKIRTARGLRDRRMRLSLDVARKFFGLQDMLGFDKASKTVEWLLTRAGDEIRKLAREIYGQNENQSSISECEVISGTDEAATDDIIDMISPKPSSSSCAKSKIKRNVRQPKKQALFNPLAKESREKARERAKKRTREKMERRQPNPCDDVDQAKMKLDLSRLSSWSTFQTAEGSEGTQSHNNMNNHSSMDVLAEVEEPISSCFQAAGTSLLGHDQDLIEIGSHDPAAANLVTMGKWIPYSFSSSLQITSASNSQEQHQFADSQILYGNPWEVIYNSSTHSGF